MNQCSHQNFGHPVVTNVVHDTIDRLGKLIRTGDVGEAAKYWGDGPVWEVEYFNEYLDSNSLLKNAGSEQSFASGLKELQHYTVKMLYKNSLRRTESERRMFDRYEQVKKYLDLVEKKSA